MGKEFVRNCSGLKQVDVCLQLSFGWTFEKWQVLTEVVTARYIKELVGVQGKTHRKVSDILRQETTFANSAWLLIEWMT